MFYTYRQNNSGGRYVGPLFMIVEADSSMEADFIAEQNGIYFDGVRNGIDCKCSEHDTIKSVYDRWNDRDINLSGSVKACVGDTHKEAEKRLLDAVQKHINMFPDVQDGKIKVGNFELIYNVNAIENDQVWVSDYVISSHYF